jgi:predicted dehydrogenase
VSRVFGIGLVGAGGFGTFCVRAFEDLPQARVVAVMDADMSRADRVAPVGAARYDDLEAFLDDRAVDIVHIVTPPYLHGSIARQAAAHGKHVLVEKPLATTVEDAQAAVDAGQRSGVQLSIDYVLRHHPIHRLAMQLTRLGALGRLQHFVLENFASSEHLPPDHWFWDQAKSGGIHVEHGVHFFDLLLAHAGREPDLVFGAAQARSDGRVDRVGAYLPFGDELIATLYHSFNRDDASEQTTIRLAFEHGRATIEGWIPTRMDIEGTIPVTAEPAVRALLGDALRIGARAAAGDGERETIAATIERPERQREYVLAIRQGMTDLLAAIEHGRALTVTPQDGMRSLRIALLATDASR